MVVKYGKQHFLQVFALSRRTPSLLADPAACAALSGSACSQAILQITALLESSRYTANCSPAAGNIFKPFYAVKLRK